MKNPASFIKNDSDIAIPYNTFIAYEGDVLRGGHFYYSIWTKNRNLSAELPILVVIRLKFIVHAMCITKSASALFCYLIFPLITSNKVEWNSKIKLKCTV